MYGSSRETMESMMAEHTYSRTPLRPFIDMDREEINYLMREGLANRGPFLPLPLQAFRPPTPGYPGTDPYHMQQYSLSRAGAMMLQPQVLQHFAAAAGGPSALSSLSHYNMLMNNIASSGAGPGAYPTPIRPLPSQTDSSPSNHRYMPYMFQRREHSNGNASESSRMSSSPGGMR